jgi:hypothetical protein
MKLGLSLRTSGLALVIVAAAIFGSLTSVQEQYNMAFATFVPLEPLEPRPDSTEDSQEDGEEGKGQNKEKKEKDKKGESEQEQEAEQSENEQLDVDLADPRGGLDELDLKKAPVMISGNNVYIAWWANSTGNDEVLFRASADAGQSFADKINLSNSTGAESQDVEIAAEGDNVIVSWWERNATSDEPVVRISTDNGETFGALLRLATNGTIGGSEG